MTLPAAENFVRHDVNFTFLPVQSYTASPAPLPSVRPLTGSDVRPRSILPFGAAAGTGGALSSSVADRILSSSWRRLLPQAQSAHLPVTSSVMNRFSQRGQIPLTLPTSAGSRSWRACGTLDGGHAWQACSSGGVWHRGHGSVSNLCDSSEVSGNVPPYMMGARRPRG